ncbi:MAG: two-component regulator propeller domain-containing protein [Melioribacteraceae bacterium]|nr:two-component regulator propeller domain-containing protein [Melioribacteraceae bacterium]
MFARSFKYFFIVIILFSFTNAQDVGTWESFTSKKEVVKIVSFNDDQIWAATTGGAFMYEVSSNSFLQLAPSEGLTSPILTSITADLHNQIWFGTQLGSQPGMLNVYDSESGVIRKVNDIFNSDFSQKRINDLDQAGDTILVSTDFGLALVNPINNSFYDTFLKFGDFDALKSVRSASFFNRFFVMLEDGIAVQRSGSTNLIAPEAWSTFRFGSDISASGGYEFVEFNGKILAATNSGIFEFINNTWQPFNMSGVSVQSMSVNQATLYFVTSESGNNKVYSFNGSSNSLLFENSENLIINDIFATSTGVIYAATNSGLLQIDGSNNNLLTPEGPANNAFVSLTVDDDGVLYSGTGRDVFGIGAMRFDGENWELIDKTTFPEISSNAFHNVSKGSNNTIFLNNWGNGITTVKGDQFKTYDASNSALVGISEAPSFVVISDAASDSKGNIWALNHRSAGVFPLTAINESGESFNFEFTNPRITASEELFHLEIDQFDKKWFAVTVGDRGLYYFDENGTFNDPADDRMGVLTASDGLQSSSITALKLDKRGALWVGTNVGVSIIPDPSNPTSRITTVNGLRQQSISAIVVDPLNQKWVATVQGLFHLSEDGITVFNQYTSSNSPIPTNDIRSLAFDDKNGILYVGTDFGLTALRTSSIAPQESMEKLFIYPNPVIVNDNSNPRITIDGLIENTTIKVISVSGQLLREFVTPGGKIAFWDGKDEDGSIVPSGVYLLVAYDEDGSNVATGKVAILRE